MQIIIGSIDDPTAHSRGGLVTFGLTKSNQNVKTEKTFGPQGKTPGPVFCRAFARF
jgi:hypothetical protein